MAEERAEVEIALPKGRVVRVSASFDATTLARARPWIEATRRWMARFTHRNPDDRSESLVLTQGAKYVPMMFMSLKPVGCLGQDADEHDHCYPKHKTIGASPDVLAEGVRVVRVGDPVAPHGGSCSKHPKTHGAKVWKGSASVFVNGKPMGREGDTVKCDTGQTAPLLRGRQTVLAGDASPFAEADTGSTVEGDAQPVAMPNTNTGSAGVVGEAPSDAKPGDGSTLVAGRGAGPPPLGPGSIQGRPDVIRVQRGLMAQFRAIYNGSKYEEMGGPLVQNPDGTMAVFTEGSKGTATSLAVNRNVPPGLKIIGTVHGHREPDPSHDIDEPQIDSVANIAPSGADFAVLINNPGDKAMIVVTGRKGGELWMAVRTPSTKREVDHDELKTWALAGTQALIESGMSPDEASARVAVDIARMNGVALYKSVTLPNGEVELRLIVP